jgi:hypothetical protein
MCDFLILDAAVYNTAPFGAPVIVLHIDLLVETLQELGECVGLVASGTANAVAIANADVGFSRSQHDDELCHYGEYLSVALNICISRLTCLLNAEPQSETPILLPL